eukprot:4667731-Pyramimonas_sp.AAC.1
MGLAAKTAASRTFELLGLIWVCFWIIAAPCDVGWHFARDPLRVIRAVKGDQISRGDRQIARLAHAVWMHVLRRRQARIQHGKGHAGCRWN